MCMTDKFWLALIDAIGRPDLQADERFSTIRARHTHREALTRVLDEELSRKPTRHWLTRFEGRLPAAPVLDVATALDSEFVASTGMIHNVSHAAMAELRLLSNPLKIDGRRLACRACSPLGADNSELLQPAVRGATP
jgi:crotonobetainyl-CoA:carnitine CoA-transferase CaiB-like acyl-CoA transferase